MLPLDLKSMIQNAYHAFLSLYTLCEGKLREGIPIPPSPPHTHTTPVSEPFPAPLQGCLDTTIIINTHL